MISINNVTVSFGGWDLFKDISFDISLKERIGLVGKNGAGKSTLMKLICGENKPTSGVIASSNDTLIGYLPQQMNSIDNVTVIEEAMKAFSNLKELENEVKMLTKELEDRSDYDSKEYSKLIEKFNHANDHYNMVMSDNLEGQAEKSLLGMGFKRTDFNRQTSEFSGGWRMRIELVKILLQKPDVLLLDEPTNHLDIESIVWLENYLSQYKGAVLLISHDRRFLDKVTNRTIEIILGKIHDYKVAYSKFEVLRKERLEQQKATYENQQKAIKETEDFIERFRYKATKSNQVQSRVKMLEKMEIVEIDDEDLGQLNIKFPPAIRTGDIVLEVKEVGKKYDETKIFEDFSFVLQRGEKVALVGRNGEGKSTFAKMVVGDTPTTSGVIKIGQNVKIGYYAQNQDDLMEGDFTVLDTLDRVAVGEVRTRLRDILAAFLFKGEDIDKKVKVLSGGERSRLAMARMMLTPCNLLILDEPTNHMDMRSKEILKEAIKNYDGTVVLVSHDREFLSGLVERIYEFRDSKVKEHLGGIDEFLEKRNMEKIDELNIIKEEKIANTQNAPSEGKANYFQQKENEKIVRKIRNKIKDSEQEIARIEGEMEKLSAMMAEPEKHNIDLSDSKYFEEYSKLEQQLDSAMELWSELNEELEQVEL